MSNKKKRNPFLLPETLCPLRCEVTFEPNPALFSYEGKDEDGNDAPPPEEIRRFTGTVRIFGSIAKPTGRIVLNALNLDIDANTARYTASPSGAVFKPSGITYDQKLQMATLHFPEKLPSGGGDLELKFRGVINQDLAGPYLLTYPANGKTRYGVATQFEPTDARQAFPFFDDPAKKAIFAVTVVVPDGIQVRSNASDMYTPIAGNSGELRKVMFHDTPKMSSYLVAITAKEDEAIERDSVYTIKREVEKDGKKVMVDDEHEVRLRVITDPGESEMGRFALDQHDKSLAFYTDFFRIHYPMDKCDLIALADFAAGAMENLGAITFRKADLLAHPKHVSHAALERIATVVSHEDAHMWFGDLVTMRRWNGLWLNEAFATFMEYLANDAIHPGWRVMENLFVSETLLALLEAARGCARAIENEVWDPAKIGASFDAFAYSMGCAILHMIYTLLGREKFRQALHLYLTRHAFANAETEDLWKALEEVSGEPVRDIMNTFVFTPGYPMLFVERSADDPREISISQSRFFSDGRKDESGALWKIPVKITSRSGASATLLVDGDTKRISLPADAREWIKVNYGQTSFCRVQYSREMQALLAEAVRKKELPPVDRIGLLDDIFEFARAGRVPTTEALDFLEVYRDDDDFFVWKEIAHCLGMLDLILGDETFHDRFDAFARSFYLPHARRFGWQKQDGEDNIAAQFRALVLRGAGHHGAPDILERARAEFEAHLKHKSLDPDLRALTYAHVAQEGDEKEIRALHELRKASVTEQEKEWLRDAVGYVKDEKLFREYLEFLLTERTQDAPYSFRGIAHSGARQKITWEFIEGHWDHFVKNFATHGLLKSAVSPARRFHDREMLQRIDAFFKTHSHPSIERAIKEMLEDVRTNTAWGERIKSKPEDDVASWLESHDSSADAMKESA